MKLINFIICSAVISLSCKKSNEYLTPDHVTATVTINADIISINATSVNAMVGRYTVPVINTPCISVKGWGTNNNNVRLVLPDQLQTGTFNFTAAGPYAALYENVNTSTVYYSADNSGTITIDTYSGTYVKGSFHVSCYDSNGSEATISSGTFEGDL